MDPVVVDTLRLALGGLFAAALAHKLRDPARFAATVVDHRLVPVALARPTAMAIVGAEALTVAALASPAFAWGLLGASGLLVAYAGAFAVNLLRGRTQVDCGCLGVAGREEISWWLVARNLACAATALAGVVPVAARERVWLDVLTPLAATLALAGLYLAADQLVANRAGYRRLQRLA